MVATFEPVLLRRVVKESGQSPGRLPQRRRLPAFRKALGNDTRPGDEVVKDSGLRGRGGAGFPTGVKWTFLPKDHPGPIYLCVNADESEPCTFNNRILMEQDPHQVLEGIMLAGYAIRCRTAYIYIRYEYGRSYRDAQAAIDELYANGLLGKNILGTDFSLDIYLHRGAGAYICGEETGLIESLEGKRAWPRIKPPFPAVEGLFRKPTIVNNVETLACVTHIIDRGDDWFKSIGVPPDPKNPRDAGSYGPKLYCISGHVNKPGCVELPLGVTVRELVDSLRRRRLERAQGEGLHSRRHQHGLHDRERNRHAARFQRAGPGRLPGPGNGGGDRLRRPDQHGRRAVQLLPVHRPRVVRPMHAVPRRDRLDAEDPRPHAAGQGPKEDLDVLTEIAETSASCPARRSAAWPTARLAGQERDRQVSGRIRAVIQRRPRKRRPPPWHDWRSHHGVTAG